MSERQGIFTPKLAELLSEYHSLVLHVDSCQRASPEKLRRELDAMRAESAEYELRLKAGTKSRSPIAAGLCRAQLRYERDTNALLSGGSGGEGAEARAEDMALAAEFAMDFASSAMHRALAAAMAAALIQYDAKKTRTSEEN